MKGYSSASSTISIIAATMPFKMNPLTINVVTPSGSASSVQVSWLTPSLNGGSALTGYYIQSNNGYGTSFNPPGTFIPVGTNSHMFNGLIEGATYMFRIAASNLIYTTNAFPGDILIFSDPIS